MLETSKICENSTTEKRLRIVRKFQKLRKKGFFDQKMLRKFRGVPGFRGRSDFKHSLVKEFLGSSGGIRRVPGSSGGLGLQERKKPSLHPKRLRRPNFPKFRKIGKFAKILGFSLSSALAPRKRQLLKFERCPSFPLFIPLWVMEVMSRVSSRLRLRQNADLSGPYRAMRAAMRCER